MSPISSLFRVPCHGSKPLSEAAGAIESKSPRRSDPVVVPAWCVKNCNDCAFSRNMLDADHEPEPVECEGNEEPDDDFG